jgi:imidazolonepropionase
VSLSIDGAAAIYTFDGRGPIRGSDWTSISPLEDASVVVDGDEIVSVGGSEDRDRRFDARGCTITPGFVDCHTHLPFFGWRADEDAARLSGVRYETLHAEEGGIFRSQRLLAEASDDAVVDFATSQALSMLRQGTTTFEMKSGYGLSVDAELRQLRLAKAVAARVPQSTVATCLAAHAVPKEKSQGEWIGEIAQDLLPVAVEEGLAQACDIYVESIAFALEHAARLSQSAGDLGLRMRIHADQLSDSQAGSFAARWSFATADHLNHTSLDAIDDIAGGDTVAVLLPGATFTLRQAKKPLARDLIEAGAIVALGSDFNPGTSPIHSMTFVMSLACRIYGLKPLEALGAATVNAAFALGLGDRVGRLAPGHKADLVIFDGAFDQLTYRPDVDHVLAVICGGEIVHLAPRAVERLM